MSLLSSYFFTVTQQKLHWVIIVTLIPKPACEEKQTFRINSRMRSCGICSLSLAPLNVCKWAFGMFSVIPVWNRTNTTPAPKISCLFNRLRSIKHLSGEAKAIVRVTLKNWLWSAPHISGQRVSDDAIISPLDTLRTRVSKLFSRRVASNIWHSVKGQKNILYICICI